MREIPEEFAGAGAEAETSPEEQIMERGARARLSVLAENFRDGLKRIYSDTAFQKFLNMSPVIGDAIMGIKAIHGKEGRRRLSVRERTFYAVAAITGGAAWFVAAKGRYKEAFALNTVSEMFTQVDAWPAIIQDLASQVRDRDSRLSQTLSAVGNWVGSRKDDLKDLAFIGSEFTRLNLQEAPADER